MGCPDCGSPVEVLQVCDGPQGCGGMREMVSPVWRQHPQYDLIQRLVFKTNYRTLCAIHVFAADETHDSGWIMSFGPIPNYSDRLEDHPEGKWNAFVFATQEDALAAGSLLLRTLFALPGRPIEYVKSVASEGRTE